MNDITTLRMMIATAALAAVAALFAGGANAMLQDVEGGSGGGTSAVPATQPQTIPYLSHGIGVDASQFSGQATSGQKSLGLTGDSALTRVDREVVGWTTARPGNPDGDRGAQVGLRGDGRAADDPLPQPRDRRRRGPVQRSGVGRAHG